MRLPTILRSHSAAAQLPLVPCCSHHQSACLQDSDVARGLTTSPFLRRDWPHTANKLATKFIRVFWMVGDCTAIVRKLGTTKSCHHIKHRRSISFATGPSSYNTDRLIVPCSTSSVIRGQNLGRIFRSIKLPQTVHTVANQDVYAPAFCAGRLKRHGI